MVVLLGSREGARPKQTPLSTNGDRGNKNALVPH
jgi:hypothetical protein